MRGTRSLTAVVVCSTVFALGATASPAHASATALPADAVLSVPGHGWGHGRGMGQWGARGMAESGATYDEIVRTYYAGTTLGSRSVTEDIRVLVERSPDVVVTSAAPFTVTMGGRAVHTASASYPFARARWDGSAYVLERAASHTGPWSRVTSSTAYAVFVPGDAMLELVFASVMTRLYRGAIEARYSSDDGMRAINVLPVQSYLRGVVPSEMPSSWPAEALRAQSVAARTYAIYKKLAARARGTMFDICATTQCQVYTGYATRTSPGGSATMVERATTNDAIAATAGKVVLYDGAPILAEFSSSTGGYTAPGGLPYQRAVPDPADAISPHHDWRAQIRVSEIEARWPQIGRLTGIVITERDGFGQWGGRVRAMRLDGTTSSLTISGGAWRSAFAWPGRTNGVRGTFFTVLLYEGALVRAPAQAVVPLGGTATALVQVRNTGTASWPVGGGVRVGTAEASPLANDAWISTTRAASVARNLTDPDRTSVAPGDVALFEIPLAGARRGIVTETFIVVADGISEMTPSFRVDVQVVEPWIDEGANLLSSGSFDDGIAPWRMSGTTRSDGPSSDGPRHGSRSLRLTGGGTKRVGQRVALAGGRGRTFTFGGFSRTVGTSGSGGAIDLVAAARYTDGTTSAVGLPFPKVPHTWVYDERVFSTDPARTLLAVELVARSVSQTGTAFFDGLRLYESPVTNLSFEEGLRSWVRDGFVTGDGVTAGAARDGSRSLVLTGGAGRKAVAQELALRAGRSERFVLSFWHRAEGLAADAGGAAVTLTLHTATGPVDTVVEVPRPDHGWAYTERVVSAPAAVTSGVLAVSLTDQTGRIYVDALRLTRTFTSDPSLEGGEWLAYNHGAGDGIVALGAASREAVHGAVLTGGGRQSVVQQVRLTGGAGARLTLQGWSRARSLGSGGFAGYVVVFRNADGTSSGAGVRLPDGSHPWRYTEVTVRAPKRFTRVDVYAQLNDRAGTVWFDALRLLRAV